MEKIKGIVNDDGVESCAYGPPAVEHTPPPPLDLDAIFKPKTWDEHIAYWISQLGSPPMMALFALILIAMTVSAPRVWLWNGVYLLIVVAIPLLYIAWLVRSDKITDMDVHLREQRVGPLLVLIMSLGIALLVLILGKAPRPLVLMATAGIVQNILIFLITLRWKISVHSATSAGVAVLALSLAGKAAAPVALSIPLVAWSRIRLKRHTFKQTVAGALLGAAIFLAATLLIPV